MKIRKSLLGLLVVILAVWGVVGLSSKTTNSNNIATATSKVAPTASKNISIKNVVGETALVSLKRDQKVDVKNSSYGEYVQGINGMEADAKHYWAFYVNSQMASEGAGTYKMKAGDVLEFRYTDM